MINSPSKNTTQQKTSIKIKPENLTHPRKGSKRFSIIPDEIKKRKDLSPLSKYVYGDLIKFVGKNDKAFPKRQTIADSCGISIKLVDKAIKELKEAGLIWVERRGLRKSNTYYFIEQKWQREATPPPQIVEEKSVVGVTLEMPNRVTPIGIDHSNIIHIAEERPKPVSGNFRQTVQHDMAKKMVDLWVQIIEEGGKTIEWGDKLISFLIKGLKDRFDNSIEKWRSYCEYIASSKYMMGEKDLGRGDLPGKWRVDLWWALNFKNIDKVLGGKLYGFGDRVKKPTVVEVKQATEDTIAEIKNSKELETVKKVKICLARGLGAASYKSWIKPCTFEAKEDGILAITPPTIFFGGYLKQHYESKILEAARGLFTSVMIGNDKLIEWNHRKNGLGKVCDRDSVISAINSFMDVCNNGNGMMPSVT